MNKLDSMRVFLEVSKHSSFTKAAEHLGMPKASVSQYVKDLEETLSVRLFQRTTRVVKLTEEGRIFEQRCIDLLDDVEEIETMFQLNDGEIKGRIRVDMSTGMAKNFILPNLSDFYEKYPQVNVELSSTDRKVDLIQEGFDLVLRTGELTDSELVLKKLGEHKIINCVSKTYINKYGRPKNIDDLKNHYLIEYSHSFGTTYGFEYVEDGVVKSKMMPSKLTVNNVEAYLHGALNGLGIIQVPRHGVEAYLKNGVLVEVLTKFKAKPMPVSILYPHRRNLPKRVRVFMDWIQELFHKTIG